MSDPGVKGIWDQRLAFSHNHHTREVLTRKLIVEFGAESTSWFGIDNRDADAQWSTSLHDNVTIGSAGFPWFKNSPGTELCGSIEAHNRG